ncbi:MAG: AAA family ATPase [Ignavibacterium sp.]|nr:AAA family ATPase [Ignavibacterium sp.]
MKKIFNGGASAPFFMDKYLNQIAVQKIAAGTLFQIIESEKIPHAFLFRGPDGLGKEYVAIQFAKELAAKYASNEKKEDIISNLNKLNEPYLKYIFPLPRGKNETDASGPFEKLSQDELEVIQEELKKKILNPFHKIRLLRAKNIKISSIRDIIKFLAVSFDDITYRVILISDAHLMNEESQNALLKNLEEPPKGVIFILCTAYPERLRETIRSRCWSINFAPLTDEEVIYILSDYYGIERTLSKKVAPFASGSVSSALEFIENDFDELREKTIRILRYSLGKRFHSALSEFSDITDNQDKVQLRLIIKMIITWLNDIHRFKNNLGNYFFNDHLETLQKFTTKFPDIELNEITHKIDTIDNSLKNNFNLNIAVGNIVAELSSIIPQK